MRLDTANLQGAPFDVGKLDKKDLEKGLKMIREELPDDLPSELPDALANFKIPDDVEEKLKGIDELDELDELKKAAESEELDEETLKIPPLPEEDEE